MNKGLKMSSIILVIIMITALLSFPVSAATSQTKSGSANGVLCYATVAFTVSGGKNGAAAATSSGISIDSLYAYVSYTYRVNRTTTLMTVSGSGSSSNSSWAGKTVTASNAVHVSAAGSHSATYHGGTWNTTTSITY